jgi:hypothetical protein
MSSGAGGKTTNYGSIEEGDKSFDDAQMQYLGEGKPLTREEKMRKLMRIAVPLLMAVIIVGAAFIFLLKDFGHLYPGGGGIPHSSNPVKYTDGSSTASTAATAGTTSPAATGAKVKTASSSSSSSIAFACSAHDACAKLSGNCWYVDVRQDVFGGLAVGTIVVWKASLSH